MQSRQRWRGRQASPCLLLASYAFLSIAFVYYLLETESQKGWTAEGLREGGQSLMSFGRRRIILP